MEVVYIYMKDYLGLKEKEYNFHENYKFSFDKNLKEILIEEVDIKIPNNFFGEKIVSVNAIIGENGKGKTRILDFIYSYLITNNKWQRVKKDDWSGINDFLNKEYEAEYILILKGRGESFYISSNLLRTTTDRSINKTKIFYYSNIFDYDYILKYRRNSRRKITDLSITEEFLGAKFEGYSSNSIFFNIKIQNDIRQIKFIKDLRRKYIDFYEDLKKELYLPESIALDFLWFKNTKMKTEFKTDLVKEYNKICDNFDNDLRSIKELFKRFFIINMWGIITEEEITLEKEYKFQSENSDILHGLDIILSHASIKKVGNRIYFLLDINFIDDLLGIIKNIENKVSSPSKFKFKFSIDLRKIPLEMSRVLDYRWEKPMSSGEKGLLRLFSYLHEILNSNKSSENLILLIDELDATFHPEWQRKALDLLIKYLNDYSRYIKANLTSQLIISSHSPFLIADLPKEKIIALENDGSQKDNKKLSAFGSNILDIYKQNFFLTSTFGEFAKEKITGVIEILSKGEEYRSLSKDKKNEIKFIIDSIGETLIKNKLERMYLELEKEDPVQKIKKLMKEKGITLEDLKEGEI